MKPEQIKQAIADLEKRYETTSLKNPQEEKKILNDIKALKATLPMAEELLRMKPEIDNLYAQRKEIKEKLDQYSS